MAQKRAVETAAVNISLPDTSRDMYSAFFKNLYLSKRNIQVRGSEYVMLTSISSPTSIDPVFSGTFARFTEIDPNMPWFDIDSLSEADENAMDDVKIPENLRPNYSPFYYIFDPSIHLFIFEARGGGHRVSPNQVEKFLRKLVNLVSPDAGASVNLISDKSSIQRILSIPRLRHLEIIVELPNPDENSEAEKRIKDRLREQNARRLTENLDALPGQSLVPDDQTIELAEVASSNGTVVGRGTDGGVPVEISTKSYPLKRSLRYDPDALSDRSAFRQAAQSIQSTRTPE